MLRLMLWVERTFNCWHVWRETHYEDEGEHFRVRVHVTCLRCGRKSSYTG